MQAFPEKAHQKSFRPLAAAAVFSMTGQAREPQESDRHGKKERCYSGIHSVSLELVHTRRDPRGSSSAAGRRVGEERAKEGC